MKLPMLSNVMILISAPTIDAKGKLMSRLTIEEIVDAVNKENSSNLRYLGA